MGEWKIRDSFVDVVMLVQEAWKYSGVRLVWRSEEVMKDYTGFDKEDIRIVDEEAGLKEVKCSLEVGMRIVASRDLERRGKKEGWNDVLETLIGGEDEPALQWMG